MRVHAAASARRSEARAPCCRLSRLDHVRRRQIPQRLHVGRERGGQRVERHVLAAVGPPRVAGDRQQPLVRTASPRPCRRSRSPAAGRRSPPAILVAAEHPARHLAVRLADSCSSFARRRRGASCPSTAGNRTPGSPKRLGHVDVVPVGHVAVQLAVLAWISAGELQQPRVAGAVVEPEDAVQQIAAARWCLPIRAAGTLRPGW